MFVFRHLEVLLCRVTSGQICFSPYQKVFISLASHVPLCNIANSVIVFILRYLEVLLRRVTSGQICFSPYQKAFISLAPDPQLPFSAEEYTDISGKTMFGIKIKNWTMGKNKGKDSCNTKNFFVRPNGKIVSTKILNFHLWSDDSSNEREN